MILNLNVPNAVPMYDVYSQVVYALKASEVETVVVDGKTLLKDGKLLTVDEAKAMAKAKEYGEKVQSYAEAVNESEDRSNRHRVNLTPAAKKKCVSAFLGFCNPEVIKQLFVSVSRSPVWQGVNIPIEPPWR